jgi:DNA mismatch repair protein MutS2
MVVEQADLERLAGPAAKPTGTAGKRAVGGSFSVDAEVHVRGMTVDEALEKVDRFLDQALLGGLDEVRIVHGKGTGTLRKVIWAWLRANPHVAGYQHPPEALGGTGVTVARLG